MQGLSARKEQESPCFLLPHRNQHFSSIGAILHEFQATEWGLSLQLSGSFFQCFSSIGAFWTKTGFSRFSFSLLLLLFGGRGGGSSGTAEAWLLFCFPLFSLVAARSGEEDFSAILSLSSGPHGGCHLGKWELLHHLVFVLWATRLSRW